MTVEAPDVCVKNCRCSPRRHTELHGRLSEDSNLISRLFRYRFRGDGELGGHSFGNLFLAALAEVTGDFTEAVRLSSEVLASKGHIYPATISDVRLSC